MPRRAKAEQWHLRRDTRCLQWRDRVGFAPTSRGRRGERQVVPTIVVHVARFATIAGLLPSRLRSAGLADIEEKLSAGVRLGLPDGVQLFDSPDLLAVGWLANREREKRHGARTFYNYNIRLEATNVCVASCLFCSF